MERKYRHPTRRQYHKLPTGSLMMTHVPEAALSALVLYLNNAEAPEEKNIVQILEEMLELEKIEQPIWSESVDPLMVIRKGRAVPNPLLKKIAPEKYAPQMEVDRRELSINQKLAQYQFVPFASAPVGSRRWAVTWLIRSRMPRRRPGFPLNPMEVDDGMACQMILELARAGWLNRLRRCQRCHNWLYAKFRHQTFCSTKCQQKHYAQSEEWKAKRREYMREYRYR